MHVAAVKLYIEEGYGHTLTGVNCHVRGVSVHSVCAYAKKSRHACRVEVVFREGFDALLQLQDPHSSSDQYNIIPRLSQRNRVYMSGLEADFSAQDCQSSRMLQ